LVIAIAFMLGGALGMLGLLAGHVLKPGSIAAPPPNPVWTEVPWPFLRPSTCGTEVKLYLRAKLGCCNCTTGVADDTDLDRMSDLDLVSGDEDFANLDGGDALGRNFRYPNAGQVLAGVVIVVEALSGFVRVEDRDANHC
jgi:hypothetical protein